VRKFALLHLLLTFFMRDVVLLFVHALTIVVRLARPGGARSILAESVFLKHQLLVLNRSRRRAPNLLPVDRLIAGLCGLLVVPRRLARCAIVVKPSTLLNLHRALIHRKIPIVIFSTTSSKARSKGLKSGLDSCRCRNEAAQSAMGMSSHCRTDRFGLRNIY
jgi:hypothetical protein